MERMDEVEGVMRGTARAPEPTWWQCLAMALVSAGIAILLIVAAIYIM